MDGQERDRRMEAVDIAARRKIKLLGFSIAAALVILMATIVLRQQSRPTNERVELFTLIAESETVPPPEGAVLLDRIENHKSSSAIVSTSYKSASPQANIGQHYLEQLKRAGWRRTQSDNSLIQAYCKNGLTAYVEFKPDLKLYDFSIVWQQKARAKC
jgi:hypothetical protein